jgi:hypothetical protein
MKMASISSRVLSLVSTQKTIYVFVSGRGSLMEKQVGETYDKDKTDDVPATVDKVHLPGNMGQRDRDAVNKDDSTRLIVRCVYIAR